jgi:hypothetical protein
MYQIRRVVILVILVVTIMGILFMMPMATGAKPPQPTNPYPGPGGQWIAQGQTYPGPGATTATPTTAPLQIPNNPTGVEQCLLAHWDLQQMVVLLYPGENQSYHGMGTDVCIKRWDKPGTICKSARIDYFLPGGAGFPIEFPEVAQQGGFWYMSWGQCSLYWSDGTSHDIHMVDQVGGIFVFRQILPIIMK